MTQGLRYILCFIVLILIVIGEREIPVKLKKYDTIVYFIAFWIFCYISGMNKED